MKKKLIIIGVLLLITALVGFLVVKMMYKKAERNVATEQAIVISPIQFSTIYKNAEDSANILYLNKTIQLTGIISSISNDIDNQTSITVETNDSLPQINCTIDAMYKSINTADTVTIKGINTGILTNINIINCIIIDSKKYSGPVYTPKEEQKTTIIIDTLKTKEKQEQLPSIFKTTKAQVTFDAGGGIEDIKATNKQVEASLDVSGNVNFKLAILQFKFEDVLMQQHFNEEYVESNKFPTAKFIGKIINNNEVFLTKDGTYKAIIKGQLTIHGKTKDVQTTAQIIVNSKKIKAMASLKIILADFAVKSAATDEAELKITANF
ncbi:MAG: YceI family protein [Ferruginibacter sp.]|nr:YceI family protein [Ferruginibacter sp.]